RQSGFGRRREAWRPPLRGARSRGRPIVPWRKQRAPASTSPSRTFSLNVSLSPGGASILGFFMAIGETRVAEACADGERAPMQHIAHERSLAEPLHDGVIVHQDRGLVLLDVRNGLVQRQRKVEALGLPVAGQVLGPAIYG